MTTPRHQPLSTPPTEDTTDHLAELTARYSRHAPASGQHHQRASRVLPAGSTRAVTHFDPWPLTVIQGRGSRIRDADGHEYVDLVNNYTSLIHGHTHEPAMIAARQATTAGLAFPSPHPTITALAEHLIERIPHAQRVRFTNSGTEAALLAARIARRATGRTRIVMFDGGYHGSADSLMPGHRDLIWLPYNDTTHLTRIDDTVAAVFVEPFLGAGGVIPGDTRFLTAAAQAADRSGAVLVVDEIQSLRLGYHGAAPLHGIRPDLTLLGKMIGGGFPIGAVLGSDQLMALTATNHPNDVHHAGTFNGHLAAMAAGLVTLEHLSQADTDDLDQKASNLAQDIEQSSRDAGTPFTVRRAGSILHVEPHDTSAINQIPPRALHLLLLLDGVYATPRGMINLSTATTDGDLSRIPEAYGNAARWLTARPRRSAAAATT